MSARTLIILAALSSICCGLAVPADAAQAAKPSSEKKAKMFNLKPGAEQKVCLTCHPAFEELLKKKFIHTPVRTPGCAACHDPHTSNFPKQLSSKGSDLCLTCHAGIMPSNARSAHKVAVEGKCIQCHDPHASDNKDNLRTAGNELCYGCHKEKGEEIKKVKFKHSPVEKGCITCHSPHASPQSASLLKTETPGLCKNCHDPKRPIFVKQHGNYPVANSMCTQCHNVHGSNRSGIIYDTAHKPFANKQCAQCHDSPTSPNPLALKKKGFELCRGCHNDTVNDMFNKNRLHWPAVGRDGCLNCHNPHATTQAGLLLAAPIKLCGSCHADTIDRQKRSVTKHQPVDEGMCMSCHAPHASDNLFLTVQASTLDFCGTCHDWAKHSTHPVGAKVIDKRNKNLTVECLSCHRSHGTDFKKMLPFGMVSELCTQCHVEYQR